MYVMYQRFSKKQLSKEYVKRKVNNVPGANLRQNVAFVHTPSFLPSRSNIYLAWTCDPIEKLVPGQRADYEKNATSMSSKPKPTIWSCDTDQHIVSCDSCQLTMAWMPKIKDVATVYGN